MWSLFRCRRETTSKSLFWLLKEPLIYKARLDVSSGAIPGLMAALLRLRITDLQDLVQLVGQGPSLTTNPLGQQSNRVVEKHLRL